MTSMNRVDTGAVFKHPVHCCFGCHEVFYFTLREIAGAEKLACPQCGSDINLADRAYETPNHLGKRHDRWGNRPAFLWISERFGVLPFRLMVKRGP